MLALAKLDWCSADRQTHGNPLGTKLGRDRKGNHTDVIRTIHQGRAGISKDKSEEIDPQGPSIPKAYRLRQGLVG